MFFLLRYVSTQYILDCIKDNEQLDVESYRLNPVTAPGSSAVLNTKGRAHGGRNYNIYGTFGQHSKENNSYIGIL